MVGSSINKNLSLITIEFPMNAINEIRRCFTSTYEIRFGTACSAHRFMIKTERVACNLIDFD